MNTKENVLKYLILIINFILMIFFSGSYYNFVGWVIAAVCLVVLVFFKESKLSYYIIVKQIQSYNINSFEDKETSKLVLISVAFLIISMKVGAALALFVEGAAIILFAFCILLVSGWFFEGAASGMSPGIAHSISKIVMKVYLFFNSLIDKIAIGIVNIELSILGIEKK